MLWSIVRTAPLATLLAIIGPQVLGARASRPRARDLGIIVGLFSSGPSNAITDVDGVVVGHATVKEGDSGNTGVTAIHSHPGILFGERVPAAVYVLNGWTKEK